MHLIPEVHAFYMQKISLELKKTGEAIAEFLLKAIDEIGPGNVLQVVTDNASNCKEAGKEIEKVSFSKIPTSKFKVQT